MAGRRGSRRSTRCSATYDRAAMTERAIGAPVALRIGRSALTGWRAHLVALGAVVAMLLVLFRRDARAMALLWWQASTYEHCLVILPVIAWLVWVRRAALSRIAPRGWALPLLWVAAGAFGWLLGEAAGVAFARQLGLVMMVQGGVAVIVGRAATSILLFPLLYAVFLVPAGDALVPALQTLTARMCMALLALTHVPARLDGVFITTPGGWFKVAEACSGAKFLIAMVALGVLVAHLGFRRWSRRLSFLALCVVVPVLANGLRAFATIWVAQRVGASAASGFDHIVYGWFFFAAVIAAVLAVSWRFFDRAADAPVATELWIAGQDARQRRTMPLFAAALATLGVVLVAPAWGRLVAAGGTRPIAAAARLPQLPGWTPIADRAGALWRPHFPGADRMLTARYRDAAGDTVDLAAIFYAAQDEDRELVGYGHGAVDPEGAWSWASDRPAPPGWKAERIEAPGPTAREVLTSYDVGGVVTGSATRVKLATLRHRLLGGDQRAAALLVSAPGGGDGGGRAAIDRFLAALGAPGPALDRIAAGG